MAEPIVVILQTFKRTQNALDTIRAARHNLHYGGPLYWYVADDGSPEEHVNAVLEAVGGDLLGYHSVRRGYGGNCNAAWDAADQVSNLTFWLEDDWELRQPLDLYAYAALLMEQESVGMIRLGYINSAMLEPAHDFGGRRYHTIPRDWPDTSFYAFTGHPSLRHSRYRAAYGDYPVGLGPGDTELAYAYQYRVGNGPLIVWPEGYPEQGHFAHIGSIKTQDLL